MKIADLFATRVEEKIEPVIKVGERDDEHKLASEIGSYVVTPMIETYLDDMLEHYTDTFLQKTTEIGIWISGYFGSGKSHYAKILSLLAGNPVLAGSSASKRFESRVPADAPRRTSILRSLSRLSQCDTDVLAFNLNSLADSKSRPLASLLLSQYYLSRGYSGNLIYARVIEAELDKQGKLDALHKSVETRAKKPWGEIQKNLSFYRTHLYSAACEVAPEVFAVAEDVDKALKEAERGELHNVAFFVDTILAGLKEREANTKRQQRLMLVLDESGQWIEDDSGRLSQLQALVEEAAIKGQGKLWIIVTTHGDMGSIFKESRALEGDMKKIEGRFRFKPALTTENIELVLEDRLFRKSLAGRQEVEALYESRGSGLIRALGELANVTSRTLPSCSTKEKFSTYYPFFPYQVHLIPEIVKALRSKGGRGEQMSGSTRTLLAITQDVLRAGRRPYLKEATGAIVSFDELYNNLAGEGEISPDVRTELSRIRETVPGGTALTARVAEVLFLIREVPYIPRTQDNIARLLVESVDDDIPIVLSRIEPELLRLRAAGLVAKIGEEYEFLTGERRTFEEEVTRIEQQYLQQDREQGFETNFVQEPGKNHWKRWIDSSVVTYRDNEFPFRPIIDGTAVTGTKGDVTLKLFTPLSLGRETLEDVESRSLRQEEKNTLFFLCGRVNAFDQDLSRYLAMKEVIGNWKGDSYKSEDARKLAQDRENDDLPKLERKVLDGLKAGIRTGHLVFRGSSRQISIKQGQTSSAALTADMATFWATLYPKFDKVPVRIANEQKAIHDVLLGQTTTKDVIDLKLFDKAGKIDVHCPLIDGIRVYLLTEQSKRQKKVVGSDVLEQLCGIGYGWDSNAVRVGVAALVRAGALKVVIGQKEYSNPADRDLIDAMCNARKFDRAELVLEETEVDPDVLTETRKFVMKLAKKRNIDETPSAISEAADALATAILSKSAGVRLWADGSSLPLPAAFTGGADAWRQVQELTNPVHRVNELHASQATLISGHEAIEQHAAFQTQHATSFKELRELVQKVEAVSHRLECDGALTALIADYTTANAAASFADKEVWNSLQSRKGQALLELTPLLDGWRQEARTILANAVDRLPTDLSERGLEATLTESLSAPLIQLRDSLDATTLPSSVAAFPERARSLVRSLGQQIASEVAKKQQPPLPCSGHGGGTPPTPPPTRKVRVVRISEVATVTRVSSEQEWEQLSSKLDQQVRKILNDGLDVELG